jgi:uncharacterized protein
VLPPDEAAAAVAYWGVREAGIFEGRNTLNVSVDKDVVAANLGIDLDTLRTRITSARQKLYTARQQRIHPARDEKILSAWNGLMLASLAEAARVLGRDDYRQAAIRSAAFLLEKLRRDGRLLRSYKDGDSRFNGYLEDYANLIDGLLELYQTTFEACYFADALDLTEVVLKHFAAPDGGFYDTSDDHESLIVRPRSVQDNATPSGSNAMAKSLLRLAAYTGESRFEQAALGVLSPLAGVMQQASVALGEALNAANLLIRGIQEVAIIGDPAEEATQALLHVVRTAYRPNMICALSVVDAGDTALPMLLASRHRIDGHPAAYVCRHFVCQTPVTEPEALRALLSESSI